MALLSDVHGDTEAVLADGAAVRCGQELGGRRPTVELVTLGPVLPEGTAAMRRAMAATGLLLRDANRGAVTRGLGIEAIASDDAPFDRSIDLTRHAPPARWNAR